MQTSWIRRVIQGSTRAMRQFYKPFCIIEIPNLNLCISIVQYFRFVAESNKLLREIAVAGKKNIDLTLCDNLSGMAKYLSPSESTPSESINEQCQRFKNSHPHTQIKINLKKKCNT